MPPVGCSFSIYTRFGRISSTGSAVFERYTEPARRVIFTGRYMASQAGSPEIETEHLLLGVLREDKGLAKRFLGSALAAEAVWNSVEQRKPARKKILGAVD